MRKSYAQLAAEPVPQTEPLNERQVQNNAGGFVFQLDDFKRLERFLILGSDSNTYYQTAKALTRENAACVTRCWEADAFKTSGVIERISQEGRAPKNDPAIFALALGVAHADPKVRAPAYATVQAVCRTGTHLFQFLEMVKALGKGLSSPGMKKTIKRWYMSRSPASVAYQLVKYRQRNGFTHKRALEICGFGAKAAVTGEGIAYHNLFNWAKGKECPVAGLPSIITDHMDAMAASSDPKEVARIIAIGARGQKLPWEAIPTEVKKDPDVWRALLPEMGATALVRNLGAMTAYGVLKPLADETRIVVEKLTSAEELRKGRLHPFNLLVARGVYSQGHGQHGGRKGEPMTWKPVPQIVAALEEAFYLSFKTIEPANKRVLIGLDVSGSMTTPLASSPISVAQGAAAMCMSVLRTEPQCHVFGFSHQFKELGFTPKMSLEEVCKVTERMSFGSTDCSLPMIYARKNKLTVDVFQVFTDNETYAGRAHPVEELRKYRQETGIPAKLVVVGMTATNFTIADPQDPGMLDVVGFDSAAPSVMAHFARS